MTEEWRPVVGYKGIYEVSNCGGVRTVAHSRTYKWKGRDIVRTIKQRVHKPHIDEKGYVKLTLSTVGKKQHLYVHRLVSLAFIPNPLGRTHVNHKNCIRTDNRVENLEWCTLQENIAHGVLYGETSRPGEKNGRSVLKEQDVISIRSLLDGGVGVQKVANQFGVTYGAIYNIKSGLNWKYLR